MMVICKINNCKIIVTFQCIFHIFLEDIGVWQGFALGFGQGFRLGFFQGFGQGNVKFYSLSLDSWIFGHYFALVFAHISWMTHLLLTFICRTILDISKSKNFKEEGAMLLNFGDISKNNTIKHPKIHESFQTWSHSKWCLCYIATCEPATWENCFTSSVLIVV